MRNTETRVRRLEEHLAPDDWRHWEGQPVEDWPDAALEGFIRHSLHEAGQPPPDVLDDETLIKLGMGRDGR